MDPTRFDSLTKALSSPTSRRAVLAAVFGGLVAPGREAAGRRRKGGRRATCRVESTADAIVVTRLVRLHKQNLSAIAAARTPRPNPGDGSVDAATAATTVRKGKALLLKVDQVSSPDGRFEVLITYGPAFGDTAEARFVVDLDGIVRGSVANREVVPFPAAEPPPELVFADGAPAPRMDAKPGVERQLAGILTRLNAVECSGLAAGSVEAERRLAPRYSDSECWACVFGCAGLLGACEYGVVRACLLTLAVPFAGPGLYAACFAAGVATVCRDVLADCSDDCANSNACCQFGPCDSVCCFGGTCLRPGECCERGQTACHGVSCCDRDQDCREDGACCPPFTSACGSRCCSATERCLDGRCCSVNRICGGVCCGNTCCNDVCCADGEGCDPATGACAQTCNAALDRHPCPPGTGFPRCCTGNTSCCQSGDCCLAGWECCPGSQQGCCAPGTVCCAVAGTNVCRTGSSQAACLA